MDIIITEIIESSCSIEKEVCWLKCKTVKGSIIAFWGEVGRLNRNIASLRDQVLPVHVEIDNPEDFIPTAYEESEYGLALSIPMNAIIHINPEH